MNDDVLTRGIEAGIITAEQAERLRALQPPALPRDEALAGPPLSPDDEQLRLITSFSDIFVTVGIGLFLGAVGWLSAAIVGRFAFWIILAAISWLLAEFFTRHRRMALPSIVLLLVYSTSTLFAVVTLSNYIGINSSYTTPYAPFPSDVRPLPVVLTGLVASLLIALHYWRFRVPITVAAGCAALIYSVVGLVAGIKPELPMHNLNPILLVCGLVIFALAMWFDTSDRERLTRRADIAFWLHLLASPLIVHSLISGYVTQGVRVDGPVAAVIIIIFLLLSLVAVLIDRRAMLVSGLSYAGFAFGSIIRGYGSSDFTVPITLLTLGAFILLLSAGWRSVRGFLLDGLPHAVTRHLPPRSARA